MEIEPIIEHEPSEDVGNKYDTLVGFGSGYDLPLSRQPVRDFGGEIPGLP